MWKLGKLTEKLKWALNRLFSAYRLKVILFGYAAVILAGALLLCLPCSVRNGVPPSFLDALFTATTSTCVTGLVVHDTYTYWSAFGHVVILCLIQIGGLSFMVIATLFSLLIRRTITLKERMLIVESLNQDNIQGIVRMTRNILIMTLSVEAAGALLLWPNFAAEYGWLPALGKSVFHSVSAFCNAGIDLMGETEAFSSLTGYAGNVMVNLVITLLIITGGLGFSVWYDIRQKKSLRRLSLHSKLVLTITAFLLAGGTVFFLIVEYDNPATMGNMSFGDKLLASWFQSVTTRTAGFNTIDLNAMTVSGKFMSMILMFIGGSPGSTAGGLKTVTFAVLLATVISVLRGNRNVNVFHRRLSGALVMRAITILFLSITVCGVGVMILSMCNPEFAFIDICYEVISAFGTVGQTLGITPDLAAGSKITLIVVMLLGRVGVLTTTFAFAMRMNQEGTNFTYPEEKVML